MFYTVFLVMPMIISPFKLILLPSFTKISWNINKQSIYTLLIPRCVRALFTAIFHKRQVEVRGDEAEKDDEGVLI